MVFVRHWHEYSHGFTCTPRIIVINYASGIIGLTERIKHIIESKYLKHSLKGERQQNIKICKDKLPQYLPNHSFGCNIVLYIIQ